MSEHPWIDEMRVLLATERDALRRLDAHAVSALADRKERLFAMLREGEVDDPRGLAEGLREIIVELRHNAMLFAHARDILRDAIGPDTVRATPSGMRLKAAVPGRRLSRTG